MQTIISQSEIDTLINAASADPFSLLGAHHLGQGGDGLVVRALLPGAETVQVLGLDQTPLDLTPIHPAGLFEGLLPGDRDILPYRLKADFVGAGQATFFDAYCFNPVLTDYDFFLFNQGAHYQIYEKLGAHPLTHQGVPGVLFAVWAPEASRVSVLGDFNQWDGRRHMMRSRGASGVWEIFLPHIKPGQLYKFEVRTADGTLLKKSDPYGNRFELRPATASVVHDLNQYQWNDDKWMFHRERGGLSQGPMNVYEVHLGSWRRGPEDAWLSYREAADQLVAYVKEMGFNFIEFLPLAEHPFDGSWGYQVTGFYAPTSRFGAPEDLMFLVDRCHQEGIGVILDWVPAHFPRDAAALEFFDGTHLYEHADPRQGAHADWGTLIFNYGRNEVRNFLVANALFWVDKFHVDGLRVDAVASMLYLDYSRKEGEWVPNRYGGRENLEAIEFIKNFNTQIGAKGRGAVTIAEESTAWPGVSRPVHLGGLGFHLKWNMGWMHDMLEFMSEDPIHRRFHTNQLTFALLYAFHENFLLPLSHDEVVHLKGSLLGKMPGDDWQKFANLRLLYAYMYGEPGKKLLFMGGEFGQWGEWDHDHSLDWHLLEYAPHQGLKNFVADLNRLYREQPALWEQDFRPEGFEWIDFRDAEATVVSFLRKGKDPEDCLVFVFNFTPVPRQGYRVGVPAAGPYRELLNSDAAAYGGSGTGNGGRVVAEPIGCHGRPASFSLTLPPLGALVLKAETGRE